MPELTQQERAVLLSFASRVERGDPGALNNLGVLYFRKGMYAEAMEQFKEALKVDPKFDLARENIRYLFGETGLEDPDVKRWRDEVRRDPENFEGLLRLGVSYQNMGRCREASEILGAVVEKNPDHSMARFHLASALKSQGLFQQALEHYQSINAAFAKSAVFHTDLGEALYNLGRTDEAIAELSSAIKLDADYWRSHFLLSFAYGDNGQLQEALEESRIASRLNPSFQNTEANLALSDYRRDPASDVHGSGGKEVASLESTSFTLGMAYRERGFLKEAIKEFQKALDDMPDKDRVHGEIGKIHLAEGELDAAAEAFLKTLEANGESAEAYRLLGSVYHLQGEYTGAALCYLQSFRLDSADADIMNNLGVLLYQVGLKEEAERMFKKGLNVKIYHPELNYNFLNCHFLKEEYPMAENLIQRFEAFMGKSPLLYEKHAILNYKMNRLTLALFDIESALALDKNHADALYLKALCYLREEDYRAAIDAMAEAMKACPRYTGFAFLLALDPLRRTKPGAIESHIDAEPDDELIGLLQCGLSRRFDKIKDNLMAIVENGKRRLDERRTAKAAEPAQAAATPGRAASADRKPPEAGEHSAAPLRDGRPAARPPDSPAASGGSKTAAPAASARRADAAAAGGRSKGTAVLDEQSAEAILEALTDLGPGGDRA